MKAYALTLLFLVLFSTPGNWALAQPAPDADETTAVEAEDPEAEPGEGDEAVVAEPEPEAGAEEAVAPGEEAAAPVDAGEDSSGTEPDPAAGLQPELPLVPALADRKAAKEADKSAEPKMFEDFSGLANAYKMESGEYTKALSEFMVGQIQGKIAKISEGYNSRYDVIEEAEEQRRKEAIAVFENFLVRYERYKIDPRYRQAIADVLFRIGELYREQADYRYAMVKRSYDQLMDLYNRGKRPSPPGDATTDYAKSLAVFWRLVNDFPEYRYRDMALYLLGYYQRVQEDLAGSNKALLILAKEHPTSEYAVGAWMLVGENFYSMSEFEEAVNAYNQVLTFKTKNPYYEDALYRLGWSSFQTFKYPAAIASFLALLDYYEDGKGRSERKASLQKEAIETLANSFVDEDWDGDGISDPDYGTQRAFAVIARGKPYEKDVLKSFADTLYDIQDAKHWELAAEAYGEYLKRYPLDDKCPETHDKIIGAYIYLAQEGPIEKRPYYNQRAQEERASFRVAYGKDSEWIRVHKYDTAALTYARTKLENNLLERVDLLHAKAQEMKESAGKEAARSYYAEATAAYLDYFDEFPGSKRELELRMRLAEAYRWGLEDYQKATEQYTLVRDFKGEEENTFVEQAAFQAIQTREQVVMAEAKAGNKEIPVDLFDPSQHLVMAKFGKKDKKDPTARVPITPNEIPANVMLWISEAETYLKLGLKNPEDKDFAGRLYYLVGRAYYRYGHFEESRTRLYDILDKYSQDQLLSAYAYADLARMYRMENDLDKLEELSLRMQKEGKGDPVDIEDLLGQIKDARLTARFQRSAELLKQAEAALEETKNDDPEKQAEARDLYSKAAFELEKIVDENPNFRKADLALISAARAFETVKLYEKAANLYRRIVQEERFKDSEQRELAMYFLARNYKLFFEFERSVKAFTQLSQEYKDTKYMKEALLEAATLQENDQDYLGAAETLVKYLAKFSGDDNEPKIRLLLAKLYERGKNEKAALSAYSDFIKRYGKSPQHVSSIMESVLVLATKARHDDKWKDAIKHYQMIVDLFDANQLQPETDDAARAAESAFWLAEADYKDFIGTKITEKKPDGQRTKIKKMLDDRKLLSDKLQEIHVKYKAYDWSVATKFRMGQLWKHLSDVINEAPIPPGLSPEAEEKLQIMLSDYSVKFEDQARREWREAINNARRLGITNNWTNLILVELNKYPEDRLLYPLFKEEKRAYVPEPLLSLPLALDSGVTP